MVVFTCNACGEALKKNQVEKHYYTKCRSCNVLSCIDCGKDFWGNEYEQHTKCISEEEKYSGKNYVPKPGANKNEIKQQQWFHQVQQAIDKAKTNPQLRDLLIKLKDYPNVPRKEKKFINFLSSSLNCRNQHTCMQAWKALMECVEKPKQEQEDDAKVKSDRENDTKPKNNSATVNSNCEMNGADDSSESGKKLSKRDKKEERRKKANKTEKKDKIKETEEKCAEDKPKKKKKRKRDEDEDSVANDSGLVADNSVIGEEEEEENCEPVKKKFKTKFDWQDVILEVLKSKGPELKVKKLRKKVLSEYLAQGCTERSEEKLWAKFEKKVKKVPGVKVAGDRVKLTTPV